MTSLLVRDDTRADDRVIDLVVSATPSVSPAPASSTARGVWTPFPFLVSILATLAVVGVTVGIAARGTAAQSATLAQLAVDPANPTGLWNYTALTNGVANHSLAEAAVWAAGILLFGFWVERNGGFLRAALLVALGSVGSVAGYWLFNTSDGQALVSREVGRVFLLLLENRGPRDAFYFLEVWVAVEPHLKWGGLVCGGAGVCGALMAYAVLRRQLGDNGVTVRPVKFLFAVAFVVGAVFAWSKSVPGPFPYPLFLGGFAVGVAVIIPEKVMRYVWERVRESAREKWEQARA